MKTIWNIICVVLAYCVLRTHKIYIVCFLRTHTYYSIQSFTFDIHLLGYISHRWVTAIFFLFSHFVGWIMSMETEHWNYRCDCKNELFWHVRIRISVRFQMHTHVLAWRINEYWQACLHAVRMKETWQWLRQLQKISCSTLTAHVLQTHTKRKWTEKKLNTAQHS